MPSFTNFFGDFLIRLGVAFIGAGVSTLIVSIVADSTDPDRDEGIKIVCTHEKPHH